MKGQTLSNHPLTLYIANQSNLQDSIPYMCHALQNTLWSQLLLAYNHIDPVDELKPKVAPPPHPIPTTPTGKDESPVGGATSGGWQRNSGGRCSSTHHPIGKHVSILPRGRASIPYHKIVRPADVERENALQVFDVLVGERDTE